METENFDPDKSFQIGINIWKNWNSMCEERILDIEKDDIVLF